MEQAGARGAHLRPPAPDPAPRPRPRHPTPPRVPQVLEFEQQDLAALPLAEMYERSYMHRDTVVQVAVAPGTDFVITASVDGHIKFWKKQAEGIEFAKHYKAHLGPVTGLAVSADGTLCASISTDRSVKVFDVASFDMIAMVKLPYVPGAVEWVFRRGDSKATLAVSEAGAGAVHLYDMRSGSDEAIATVALHGAPVTAMRYSEPADAVISADAGGGLEYWCPGTGGALPAGAVSFSFKLDTDLYALAKAKAHALSLDVSKDGSKFVVFSSDRCGRAGILERRGSGGGAAHGRGAGPRASEGPPPPGQ